MQAPAIPALGEERTRLINAVSGTLAGVVGYDQVVRTLPRCAVPVLAELVILLVRDEGTDRLEVAHIDRDQEQPVASRLEGALPALRFAVERELSLGRTFRWLPRITNSSLRFLSRRDPRLPELLKDLEIHSLIVVPLCSEGQNRGAMAFARVREDVPLQAADLAVAQMIARPGGRRNGEGCAV